MKSNSKRQSDEIRPEESDVLKTRHWYLIGDILKRALEGKGNVTSKMLENLIPEDIKNAEPQNLLGFYASHERVDEFDEWFSDLQPEMIFTRQPIAGGGVGEARFVSQHQEEMTLAFLYLLMFLKDPNKPAPAPVSLDMEGIQNSLDKLKQTKVAPVLGHKHSPFWLMDWLQECNGAADEATKKRIAKAKIDSGRVREFEDLFWKAFKEHLPLLGQLMEQEAFIIDDTALTGPAKTRTRKREFIKPFGGVSYISSGEQFGRGHSRSFDEYFIKEIAKTLSSYARDQRETPKDLSDGLNSAAEWLETQDCNGNSGIILVPRRFYLEDELRDDKIFLPQWRDPESVAGFSGRYRNFLIRSHALSRQDCLLALSLVSWKPLRIRNAILEDTKWGTIIIRDFEPPELKDIETAYGEKGETVSELDCRQYVLVVLNLFAQFDLNEAESSARLFSITPPSSLPQ